MMFNQRKTNNFTRAIFYVGPTLALYVVKPTQENMSLSNFYVHLAHDDVGPTLVLRCAPNANFQAPVQRFAYVGPT